MNTIIIENIKDFNLKETFECGQCFRWNAEDDGSYTGIAMGRVANIRLEPARFAGIAAGGADNDGLGDETYGARVGGTTACCLENADFFDGSCSGSKLACLIITGKGDEEFWRNYLDLDRDYGEIKNLLMKKEPVHMPHAIAAGLGIRLLKQELWETLINFIISQNNNIPRIKGCTEKLAEISGNYIGDFRGKPRYSLPAPEKLASMSREELAPARLGYRDKYLIESAERWLNFNGETEMISSELCTFSGVGPKVEACIRLFGLHDIASFPIDVWVKRLMNRFYGFDENDTKGMTEFAKEHFGEYAGLAQQYLFNYIRKIDG